MIVWSVALLCQTHRVSELGGSYQQSRPLCISFKRHNYSPERVNLILKLYVPPLVFRCRLGKQTWPQTKAVSRLEWWVGTLIHGSLWDGHPPKSVRRCPRWGDSWIRVQKEAALGRREGKQQRERVWEISWDLPSEHCLCQAVNRAHRSPFKVGFVACEDTADVEDF